MTGILTLGKMSVGVREITSGLINKISSAMTMNVYGRFNAILTIHTSYTPWVGRAGEVSNRG